MSQIISTYPIFEGSQVLTSDQLNQLGAYLDQQTRLTRSKLIGMGICCGLQIRPAAAGLTISMGLGVTSKGFLIQIGEDFLATHYRPYTLPEGVTYKPFSPDGQEVVLHELLSKKPEDDTGVQKLSDTPNFLQGKFVLLFLEIVDRDLKSCLGNACDDKGQDRIFSLRRLIVDQSGLDLILTESANVSADFSTTGLKRFRIKKALFDPSKAESQLIGAFIGSYQKILQESITSDFWESFRMGYQLFEPLLAKSFGFKNPFEQAAIITKISQIQQCLTDAPATVRGIQYLYDFFKEINLAWEEFLETTDYLWFSCPTDSSLFPLHLMLGKALPTSENPTEYYNYRHGWVQPPIFNDQRLLKETLAQRYRRLVLMIETLELELIRNPKPEKFPIKITPSREKHGALGKRSIPYYYQIKSKGTQNGWFSLEKNWTDPTEVQLWSSDRAEVLSYDNQPDSPISNPSFLEAPLTYDWEQYPFLRIEGHLDHQIDQAVASIEKLIREFNLPIQVEKLHLDPGNSPDEAACCWHDLQEEYQHHRLQLLGMIRDIREILNFLRAINKKYGQGKELFGDKEENQTLNAFKLFEVWVDSLTDCLDQLDWEKFQESYKKILQTLLDFLLIQMKFLDRVEVQENEQDKALELYNGLLTRVSPLVYRILDLFYFTKIQRLYLSFIHRKAKLKQSRRFSEYLKRNPGLTHEAGVYRGGTFFLLYMESSKRIIGDFSLPGSACECSCISACDDKNWNLLPPFARPDYAVTVQNKAIQIEVIVNDRLPLERNYTVKPFSDFSEKGGIIKQENNSPIFIYEPPKDYAGDDAFTYLLRDEESGLSDLGRVTIWIKSPKPKTCYSAEILTCWGEKNVLEAVRHRKLDPGNSFDFAIASLLSSLSQTGGFTEGEIRGAPFLENENPRRQLVQCLGLFQEGMSYEDMGKAILEYQQANCGARPSEPICTSTSIAGTVMSPAGTPIGGARVSVEGTTNQTLTDQKGQFQLQFPIPGQTILIQAERFISQTRDICNESMVQIVLTPLQRAVATEPSGVVIGVAILAKEDLLRVASNRGLIPQNDTTVDQNELIKLIENDKQEVILAKDELSLLKNDTLKTIANERDLTYLSNSTKSTLVNLISGKK